MYCWISDSGWYHTAGRVLISQKTLNRKGRHCVVLQYLANTISWKSLKFCYVDILQWDKSVEKPTRSSRNPVTPQKREKKPCRACEYILKSALGSSRLKKVQSRVGFSSTFVQQLVSCKYIQVEPILLVSNAKYLCTCTQRLSSIHT